MDYARIVVAQMNIADINPIVQAATNPNVFYTRSPLAALGYVRDREVDVAVVGQVFSRLNHDDPYWVSDGTKLAKNMEEVSPNLVVARYSFVPDEGDSCVFHADIPKRNADIDKVVEFIDFDGLASLLKGRDTEEIMRRFPAFTWHKMNFNRNALHYQREFSLS
ncbi:hypothetical protein J4401_01405 [Candidatus Woesearchaeota archaeon]|nr:hypothetical protein [Candidatus Woesearchaeota archaeon]